MSKFIDEVTEINDDDLNCESLVFNRESKLLNEMVLRNFDEQLKMYFSKVHGVTSISDIAALSKHGQIKHYVTANKREFYFNDKLVISVFIKNNLSIVIDTFY